MTHVDSICEGKMEEPTTKPQKRRPNSVSKEVLQLDGTDIISRFVLPPTVLSQRCFPRILAYTKVQSQGSQSSNFEENREKCIFH